MKESTFTSADLGAGSDSVYGADNINNAISAGAGADTFLINLVMQPFMAVMMRIRSTSVVRSMALRLTSERVMKTSH